MNKISVVINTIKEEVNLPGALKSVKGLADEVIVVDMHSSDKTVEIAKKAGAKVYDHKRTGYVEPARNFAIKKATGDWIFILDADERVPKTLTKRIRKIVKDNNVNYVAIPRRNIVFGKWLKHSRWWPDYNVRFFKKGKVTWDEKIHSIPKTFGDGIDLEPKKDSAILHYNYNSLSQFIKRMDRYTSIQSKELVKEGYKFKWQDVFGKPLGEFLSRYFKGFGYKDGLHGLALSILQAFSETVVYLKVWELQGFKKEDIKISSMHKEFRNGQKDLNYWIADLMYREKGNYIYKIKRKLRV